MATEWLHPPNETLTARNRRLRQALDRQRTASDDLRHILYSTDIATLLLDPELTIRFFTPAIKALFDVMPGDVGRPLADLQSLGMDKTLAADARTVLRTLAPIEREVETEGGVWFMRRVLPYRTLDGGVHGVVVTFTDIAERKQAARALEEAQQRAERAQAATSRGLAAVSHDLRQPLQTLMLLQGVLARAVEGGQAAQLAARFDAALGAMAGLLDTLVDLTPTEAGVVPADFAMDDVLDRLRHEFAYRAQARGLALRVVPCSLVVRSDPRLLQQMLRALLSNALGCTRSGKVLLGCRRRGGVLGIEVWDAGEGRPGPELPAAVRRLGDLLGHPVRVRPRPGHGLVAAVDVPLPGGRTASPPPPRRQSMETEALQHERRRGAILIVEDDPVLRELLELVLREEGHRTMAAPDGPAALELAAGGAAPDLMLADHTLPNGLNGLQLAVQLRGQLGRDIPVVILTGDLASTTLRDVALHGCVRLDKPLKLAALTAAIDRLLAAPPAPAPRPPPSVPPRATHDPATIFIVDDDSQVRDAIRAVLEEDGRPTQDFASCEAFLDAYRPGEAGCLLIDAYLPGMGGLELLQRLRAAGDPLPAIVITGNGDVPMAVEAMKAGASDFFEKPIGCAELLASIARALETARDTDSLCAWRARAASHIGELSPRQREVMDRVLAGQPSKNIAADLGISQRTVESHRASIMKRTGSRSVPELVRLALACGCLTEGGGGALPDAALADR